MIGFPCGSRDLGQEIKAKLYARLYTHKDELCITEQVARMDWWRRGRGNDACVSFSIIKKNYILAEIPPQKKC